MAPILNLFLSLAALFSSISLVLADLTAYTGSNGVGTIDIEVPASNPQTFGPSVLKNGSRPAFRLDTVLFTLYYPSAKDAKSTKPGHQWLPEPRILIAQGLSSASGGTVSPSLIQLGFDIYTRNLSIPAQVDVPIANGSDKYPVLLFSHGQPTMADWYSQLYGELASRGVVVVSATHRDGSSPATVVEFKNGTSYNITAFTAGDITCVYFI
jgi:platelet-activating factor acetylhydrolase